MKEGAKILEREIPESKKLALFKKEQEKGLSKVHQGYKEIRANLGKPKAMRGLLKIQQGKAQIQWANRQILKVHQMKYWKQ